MAQKIIKDVIYGEFVITEPFVNFINCKEFLRLKKIKQTGFSYFDYPGLENNNRYEHSLGVFYLIGHIINHIELELKHFNITIPKEEKDIALTAMLLHDIGHGPYSHMFEHIYDYPHERRTVDIIKGNTELNKELKKVFSQNTIDRICNFLLDKHTTTETSPFIKMLKSLISSQIDADRMDYAIRDRYWAGLKTAIDYKKITSSLGVSVDINQNFELVIKQEDLMFAECLLLERTQNFEHIYFTKSARLIEGCLFKQILKLAKQETIELPEMFVKFINLNSELTLDMFFELNDSVFDDALKILSKHAENPLLKIITQKNIATKFYEINFVENFEQFKSNLLNNYTGATHQDTCAIIKDYQHITLYKDQAGIKVAVGNQSFSLNEISLLIKTKKFELNKVYFSPELLNLEHSLSHNNQKMGFEDILKTNTNSHEFELKYLTTISDKEILNALTNFGFSVVDQNEVINTDTYYDTHNFDMLSIGGSLRTRLVTKNNQQVFKATYKTPKSHGQVFSHRTEVEDFCEPNFASLKRFLVQKNINIPNLKENPVLTAETSRKNIIVSYLNSKACISIDNTKYTSNKKSTIGKMIEIEAMGDTQQRVILTQIYEILKNELNLKNTISKSKYSLGIDLLKIKE